MSAQGHFNSSCIHCKDSGWIGAIHKILFTQYAFQCGMCFVARQNRISALIPIWSSKQKLIYERYDEFVARDGFAEVRESKKQSEKQGETV